MPLKPRGLLVFYLAVYEIRFGEKVTLVMVIILNI